ncbi:MAG TPA: hypothetical protein VFA04_07685 [Bryobacteraceae bacterium]|nr:hypothetical protein [Bryobacteraceae bacterium]
MNSRSTPSIALYLLLVFASGILVGVFGYRLYTVNAVRATSVGADSQQARRDRFVSELKQRLGLSPEQVRNLNVILDQGRARFKEIHSRIDPEMAALRREQDSRIRGLLNSRQSTEFDRWKAEREKKAANAGR